MNSNLISNQQQQLFFTLYLQQQQNHNQPTTLSFNQPNFPGVILNYLFGFYLGKATKNNGHSMHRQHHQQGAKIFNLDEIL